MSTLHQTIQQIKERLDKAITEYGNATFDCGAWPDTDEEDGKPETYKPILAHANDARDALQAQHSALCNALEIAVKTLEEIGWSKLSREPMTQSQDQRVAKSALAQIEAVLK